MTTITYWCPVIGDTKESVRSFDVIALLTDPLGKAAAEIAAADVFARCDRPGRHAPWPIVVVLETESMERWWQVHRVPVGGPNPSRYVAIEIATAAGRASLAGGPGDGSARP